MDSLIQNFPEGTRPTPIEILTARGDQRKPVQQTISKTDLELKVATISCEYLEELYLQSTLNSRGNQFARTTEDAIRQFDMRACEAIDKYLDADKSHCHKIREFMVIDESNDRYPYLVMLLLFRAGLHKEAIWFSAQ